MTRRNNCEIALLIFRLVIFPIVVRTSFVILESNNSQLLTVTDQLHQQQELVASLQSQLSIVSTQCQEITAKYNEQMESNAKLIGHKNTKQKIQLMMDYKGKLEYDYIV